VNLSASPVSPRYHQGLAPMSTPTCVIAGAGPGLSLAVAERYAREGFTVYALSRTAARLSDPASRLRSRVLNVEVIECEPRNVDSVETAIEAIETHGGSCDVLVYNAFVDDPPAPSSFAPRAASYDPYAELADVVTLIRRRVAAMRPQRGGALVFATYDSPESETKTLREFVDALADEIEPAGIRVGIVVIDGALPTSAPELASIADVYWDVFFCAEHRHRRERRVRTRRPFA
jgi:NAD(P)-dependent dehydrogenase (short-subunit alcohol dehydrogenase family)